MGRVIPTYPPQLDTMCVCMCVHVHVCVRERERHTHTDRVRCKCSCTCSYACMCVCNVHMHMCVCTCTCLSAHACALFYFLKHHGSVPERKFGLEDGLTHEPSSLANEEMVEAALHWHGVHVKHFIPQVERHTENTWSTCQTLHMWRDILKHTEYILLLQKHNETH